VAMSRELRDRWLDASASIDQARAQLTGHAPARHDVRRVIDTSTALELPTGVHEMIKSIAA
jgi:hypothetical protein